MSAVRSEPAEVWLIDGRPARFVWRERLYTVLSILARPSPSATDRGESKGRAEAGTAGTEADEASRAHSGELASWRCWKVSATSGRNVPASAYRLCQDPASKRWMLTRIDR